VVKNEGNSSCKKGKQELWDEKLSLAPGKHVLLARGEGAQYLSHDGGKVIWKIATSRDGKGGFGDAVGEPGVIAAVQPVRQQSWWDRDHDGLHPYCHVFIVF
jgi:hypothetical protein